MKKMNINRLNRLCVCFALLLFGFQIPCWAANCDPCEAVDVCSPNGNGKVIEIDVVYTGGVFGNVRGGERTGSTYMGLAELGFTGDSEKLGLWKNGTFFVGG